MLTFPSSELDQGFYFSAARFGRPYCYVREIARVEGKPKFVNQVCLGTAERILEMVHGEKERGRIRKLEIQEFE